MWPNLTVYRWARLWRCSRDEGWVCDHLRP